VNQRRLEIAALATEPQVLCLDEPAPDSTREKPPLMDLSKDQSDGYNGALIEHDMRLVMGVTTAS